MTSARIIYQSASCHHNCVSASRAAIKPLLADIWHQPWRRIHVCTNPYWSTPARPTKLTYTHMNTDLFVEIKNMTKRCRLQQLQTHFLCEISSEQKASSLGRCGRRNQPGNLFILNDTASHLISFPCSQVMFCHQSQHCRSQPHPSVHKDGLAFPEYSL